MARPPYLRWAAAAVLVLLGLVVECGGPASSSHPFTSTAIASGEAITAETIEWREVPAGVLATPTVDGRVAAVDIPAGTPLVTALITTSAVVPNGWWAIALDLPSAARPGAEVLVFLPESGLEVPGIVVESATDGGFGIAEPGVVAVPPQAAAAVATAYAHDDVVVATRP